MHCDPLIFSLQKTRSEKIQLHRRCGIRDTSRIILQGTLVSLIHPALMDFLFLSTLWTGYLGWQWRRTRTIPEELKQLKKELPEKDAEGNRPVSKVDGRIAALEEVRSAKALSRGTHYLQEHRLEIKCACHLAATQTYVQEGVQGQASQLGRVDHGSWNSDCCGWASQHISSFRYATVSASWLAGSVMLHDYTPTPSTISRLCRQLQGGICSPGYHKIERELEL